VINNLPPLVIGDLTIKIPIIQGGMGVAAGGNINPSGVSMFEPIGGSAPKYTGKNIINPLAAICSGAMLLETLGEDEAAAAIETAVKYVTSEKMKIHKRSELMNSPRAKNIFWS
jgi:isocitrate/isopropylmalate dehydrogenase